jgi:hypothetical protein
MSHCAIPAEVRTAKMSRDWLIIRLPVRARPVSDTMIAPLQISSPLHERIRENIQP